MIAYIAGKLVAKDPTHVIIDVGGVGYKINISLNTYTNLKEGEACKLHTYLHIKEDAHTLYGFNSEVDKAIFLDLISISGVGPSTGLMVQSSLSGAEIRSAIINEQVKVIQSVKGIGAKTAQRIILELKDKMKRSPGSEEETALVENSHNTIRHEALSALTTLGINKSQAERSIDSILKKTQGEVTLEELIKLSLKTT